MANYSIVDPSAEETGNPKAALEAASPTTETKSDVAAKAASTEDRYKIPDKFVGKSLEEVLTSYQQLETAFGRAKQELGQERQTRLSLDQMLQQKRESDLRAYGGSTQQQTSDKAKPELSAADLLENPSQALDSYLEQRESVTTKQLRDEQASLRAQLLQQQFVSRHPDWQTETNDPDFVSWARQTPYRQGLAGRAAQEDLVAADALLSEYKAYKPLLNQATAKSTNLEAARKVGLERSAVAGDETRPVGKVIRRIDSQALMTSDPERYYSDAYQKELMTAISDGRYK
jgi:hypothetical protein